MTNADAIAIVALLRYMQSEPLSFDTYSVAGAAERAANAIEALRTALTASEKDAEELRWLKAHPDELCSAVQDAYGQWSGEDPADFSDILADEITHQRAKV